MASFVSGGDLAFDAIVYGAPTQNNISFFNKNQLDFSKILNNEIGKNFIESTKSLIEKVNNSTTIRTLRAIGRSSRHIWQSNVVHPLLEIGAMQNAPPIMQKWIMAEPEIRTAYLNQRVDGYSHSYKNNFGNLVGEEHSEYREVMNGILVETDGENDKEASWYVNNYTNDLSPDDNHLTPDDQFDIIQTWAEVKKMLKNKKDDPTSIFNSSLE